MSISLAKAFRRLESQPGYEVRPAQRRMAQFVGECFAQSCSGVIEAPTGVGKSLAVLLPAIIVCALAKKRIVISTYTNVLAEQYWLKDLPLALSLFPEVEIRAALAMGRTRYACLDRILAENARRVPPELQRFVSEWALQAHEGTENELSDFLTRKGVPMSFMRDLFHAIAVPPYCRARACEYYEQCFYYKNRQRAENAQLVITNHAVVLTDALLKQVSNDDRSILGEYDFLVVDEAHDLIDACKSALEFELSYATVQEMVRTASIFEHELARAVESKRPPAGFLNEVSEAIGDFSGQVQSVMTRYQGIAVPQNGTIFAVAPAELASIPLIQRDLHRNYKELVSQVVLDLQSALSQVNLSIRRAFDNHKSQLTEPQRQAVAETMSQFDLWYQHLNSRLNRLIDPPEGVSWVEREDTGWKACYQPLDVSDWLRESLFANQPTLLMSATLTIDGSFDFYLKQVGMEGVRTLQLPPVFDYPRQCAIYLPPIGTIPDPPKSAQDRHAEDYYKSVAQELARLLRATHGRALVLFASRAEMSAVREYMPKLPGIRIFMQGDGANAQLSKQFREHVHSVLFGLRSFWTGFDAPGETLTNLIVVRIPFEVPTTPPQRARQALLQLEGKDPFMDWSLPLVKQQLRQGFGRLIRKATDTGVVCLLDPRFQNRSYGAELVTNLPKGIPIFGDIEDALCHIGQV